MSMQGMLRISSAWFVVARKPALCGSDGAGAGGSKGAKSTPSVKWPGPAFVALETITPEHIRWHVRYLPHDLLEGRRDRGRAEAAISRQNISRRSLRNMA